MEEQKKTWIPACARMTDGARMQTRPHHLDPRVREDDAELAEAQEEEEEPWIP